MYKTLFGSSQYTDGDIKDVWSYMGQFIFHQPMHCILKTLHKHT